MPHILHPVHRLPWFGFVLGLLLFCSCREQNVEDLEFPYAKKKYFAEMFLPDTGRKAIGTAWKHPGPDNPYPGYSILAHALDSHFQVKPEWKFCEPFLWLQSDSLVEDKARRFPGNTCPLSALHCRMESDGTAYRQTGFLCIFSIKVCSGRMGTIP